MVGGTDFLIFNQQFNTLIKAGLPILKALDLLAERAAVPALRPILRDVRDRVREGALLSEALEKEGVFPKVFTTSVLAGEKSGNLELRENVTKMKKAERLSAAGQLAASLAHEIRNPLASISGAAGILQRRTARPVPFRA